MRNISANALAFLSQQQGIEPLNIVEISWTDSTTIFYCDSPIYDLGIQGKILDLANLENVVNISGSSNSESVNIVLDDSDGSIKEIYNYNDIHKRRVRIYQWFEGLNFADKFIIFVGEISSPIVWKEGDRTLSFEIISKLEDMEIGFSPEEGNFDNIPDDMVGQAWPLPFGTVLGVKCLQIDPIPTGIVLDSNGVPDPGLVKTITDLGKKIIELMQLAQNMFQLAVEAYTLSHYDENGAYQLERINEQYESQGDQYVDQGNQYLVDLATARIDLSNAIMELNYQKKYGKKAVRTNGGECFPQNQQMNATIGGVKHTGSFNGSDFNVDSTTHPTEEGKAQEVFKHATTSSVTTGGQDIIEKVGFVWIPAGEVFKMTSPLPVRYVVSMIPATVLNVWARKNVDDTRVFTQVPQEYYSVSLQAYGTMVATIITFSQPLSQRDKGWDDEIHVDVQSSVGPNTVDIIEWIIINYSTLAIDATSFNYVRMRLANFTSNFCLKERKNVVQLLNEIAYQARCAIWMNNGVFFLRFLVDEPVPVDTITKDDIIVNTLEIHHTGTEDIVTKLIASYKTTDTQEKDYKIILRNNIYKYGTHQSETNWYIYNVPDSVDLAATFWLIRKSNTWKLLHFRTPLHKLRLETFDAVTIDFSGDEACTGPVTGIINSVQFNSQELELEFEVWIPVRLGEMTKYLFAWPVDSTVNVYPAEIQIQGPSDSAEGDLKPLNAACLIGPRFKINRRKHTRGHPNPGQGEGGTIVVRPDIQGLDNTVQPFFDRTTRDFRTNTPIVEVLRPGAYPAKIVSGDGPKYKVAVYLKGLDNPITNTFATNVDHKEKLTTGTWITVIVVSWQEASTVSGSNTSIPKQKAANYFLPSTSKPGAYAGQVLSGTGQTYQVGLYKNGYPGDVTDTVTCKQLQIDINDKIPAGSMCIVVEGSKTQGGTVTKEYYMQLPVWME
jgi:hypothetical protein